MPLMLRTLDGGDTWMPFFISAPAGFTPTSIFGLNGQQAWVAMYDAALDNQGRIYKTTNGGSNWTLQSTADFADAARLIHFFDANDGVAVGDSSVFVTANGGTDWTRMPTLPIPGGGVTRFDFNSYEVKGNTIWVGDEFGRFFKSVDKGHTWALMPSDLSPYGIKGIAFRDSLNGLAIVTRSGGTTASGLTDDGRIYRTTDGGSTWNYISFNIIGNTPQSLVKPNESKCDIAHVPNTPGTYIVTSEDNIGYSAISTDAGVSWNLIDSNVKYTALAFLSPTVGWAGGHLTSMQTSGLNKWVPPVTNTDELPYVVTDSLTLYPNPVGTGQLNVIGLDGTPSDYTYTVQDVRGSIVAGSRAKADRIGSITIDVDGLVPGLYLLNVMSGMSVHRAPFIKK
jgi:photosystem II stability/assembly factor-like uncharacterized protein